VRDYPNSDYAESKEQLQLYRGVEIPPPNPERTKVLPPEKKSRRHFKKRTVRALSADD